jgi:hypothetical protein
MNRDEMEAPNAFNASAGESHGYACLLPLTLPQSLERKQRKGLF